MRLREHTAAACLFILIICATASVVAAQEFMQPPFVPPAPGTPSLLAGRFYIQAGVKYRSLESLRFDVTGGPLTLTSGPGTVPFGPAQAGAFGVGTGREGFTGTNGPVGNPLTWAYNNGQISGDVIPGGGVAGALDPCFGALNPALPTTCDNAGTTISCNCDFLWTYTTELPSLGRYRMGGLSPALGPGTCCDSLIVPVSQGSFTIADPTVQVNNPNSIVGTTTVTYQAILTDSLSFNVFATPVFNREIGPQLWSPVFEAGFQLYDFFDLYYGFSWFNVGNSTGISHVLAGTGARTVVQDTFPFVSDQTPDSGWPIGSWTSSNTIIGSADPATNFQLSTNNTLRGIHPTRAFITQQDDSIPVESIQEIITNRTDIDVYEFRMGGRTWQPLFGLGRIGAIMGGTFMPAYYRIAGNRNYVSAGPNAPGQVLLSQSRIYKDWRPHYGGFVGADLELGYGSVYANASIDYTWVNAQTYQMLSVETSFNPGGMTVAVTGGFHF